MIKKQKFISVLLLVFLIMLFYVPSVQAKKKVAGKTFYTTANIWYEHPKKNYSTNYHRGAILPVGTIAKIKKVRSKEIQFTDENGQPFIITFLKKHSSHEMTIWDYFDQYFSEENPMREGGPFHKLSKDEKDNIEMGEIAVGMSKNAVLMSYGYPPSHRTPSLKSNRWIYWITRFINRPVYFVDGKVSKWR